jgi:hypothetical protein
LLKNVLAFWCHKKLVWPLRSQPGRVFTTYMMPCPGPKVRSDCWPKLLLFKHFFTTPHQNLVTTLTVRSSRTRPSVVLVSRDQTLALFLCSCSIFSGRELDTSGKRQHSPYATVPTPRCWWPCRVPASCSLVAPGPPRPATAPVLSLFRRLRGHACCHGRRRRRCPRRASPSARESRPSTRAVRRPAARTDTAGITKKLRCLPSYAYVSWDVAANPFHTPDPRDNDWNLI